MYIACGGEANAEKGTTNLHEDVADAVNFVTWTFNPQLMAAIWHIFPRGSDTQIRMYLQERRPELRGLDPLQAQLVYLTDADLEELAQKYKVAPWIVHQRAGDMLFIPAGCAHQVWWHINMIVLRSNLVNEVCNVQSAVKIACDFVSVHNIEHMHDLIPRQREQRLAGGEAEDVLQLSTVLWYAWISVCTFKEPSYTQGVKPGQ